MISKSIKFLILILIFFCEPVRAKDYDLTVVGPILFPDGIGRLSILFMDMLKSDLKINCISNRQSLTDVPKGVQAIVKNPDKRAGNVALLTDFLWVKTFHAMGQNMPDSLIKIAYSMLESTAIPEQWVIVLNTKFDAVVVPDISIKEIYMNSGVKIPIFELPHPIYIEEFLGRQLKTKKNKPFVFGMSAGLFRRKNHLMLLNAFAETFGNNPKVKLKIHSRFGDLAVMRSLEKKIRLFNFKNIEFIRQAFSRSEYIQFMSSLDCYVLLSRGEGFSVTPREALALGIPCILSYNTAQITICDTGFVKSVASNRMEPAFYDMFDRICGADFNCTKADVKKALQEVYTNYNTYLLKAHEGREWVKQYQMPNLKQKYLALIKPKKVLLSDKNCVTDDYLETDSKALFEKYSLLISANQNANS